MKGRILQLNTSIPLKCGTGCLFIKLKFGRVGMGKVLHLGPSWHGPSFKWAELAWAGIWVVSAVGRIGRVVSAWVVSALFWGESIRPILVGRFGRESFRP